MLARFCVVNLDEVRAMSVYTAMYYVESAVRIIGNDALSCYGLVP
jgi:hypothetical protein